MAQELVTMLWCDVHPERRVEARTITVNGQAMEICSDCETEFKIADLGYLLSQHGRPAEADAPRPRPAGERKTCPHGCTNPKQKDGLFVSERGLARHLKMAHR